MLPTPYLVEDPLTSVHSYPTHPDANVVVRTIISK